MDSAEEIFQRYAEDLSEFRRLVEHNAKGGEDKFRVEEALYYKLTFLLERLAILEREKALRQKAEEDKPHHLTYPRSFLHHLLTNSTWYHTAIELDHGVDGIELEEQAKNIVNEGTG